METRNEERMTTVEIETIPEQTIFRITIDPETAVLLVKHGKIHNDRGFSDRVNDFFDKLTAWVTYQQTAPAKEK